MKTLIAAILAFSSTSALAKELRFEYPCRSYHYVGKGENQKEKSIKAPNVMGYSLVKTAFKDGDKWENHYAIEVTLKSEDVIELVLVSSGSGDEGYNEYKILAWTNPYWISSGSIYNDGSGGSFEGQDGSGESIFFECRK